MGEMFVQSKITLIIVSVVISLHIVLGWLPPERCEQSPRTVRQDPASLNSSPKSPPVGNITEIAYKQNEQLKETYKNYTFSGVPTSGYFDGCDRCNYTMYVPSKCTFYTNNPRVLSSVYCQEGVSCKLAHIVSTTESYTAFEGYNWGVRFSAKVGLAKTFEIGGEVSVGGSYTCTYTKARTKTDNVECAISSVGGKTLQLYTVHSDMECEFGTVTMVPDTRNGKNIAWAPFDYFTTDERKITEDNAIIKSDNDMVLPDLDKIPDRLLEKMKSIFPDYNPYTDFVALWKSPSQPSVTYFKESSITAGTKNVIPFTNEAGDSVFQYACVLT